MKNINYLIKLSLILIIAFISSIGSLIAQDTEYDKNAVFINYGNIIFASQVSFSLERTIYQKERFRTKLKVNYGKHLSNHYDLEAGAEIIENYKSVSGVLVFHFFEINLGVAFTKYSLERGPSQNPLIDYSLLYNGTSVYGNVGIRYEKDGVLLRAGAGNLELLSVGIGFTF